MIEAYQIEAISIGNGTASRETEDFINSQSFDRQIPVFVVSEQGASIYSASKIARDEFPDYDVTVRGAVSIGRRLMDPLAELVKIDPKSIGVGQYQHDVDQTKLKKALDQTVENCVNLVGVNLNTASSHLLTYISGLGPQLAQNIVNYRAENGAFGSRKELMKVPRMGAKAFEQCAGFLRIPGAKNPLVHRTPPDGSVGRVCEDRSKVYRRGLIPTRCRPDEAEERTRSDGRELRESSRGKSEYGKQSSAYLYFRFGPSTGTEYRQLPGRERSFRFAERTDESAAHGRQSLRAMRRISSHPRS